MTSLQAVVVLVILAEFVTLRSYASVKCEREDVYGMMPELRQLILDGHNMRRSNLAKGLEQNMMGKAMPEAKNMYKLEYSCKLEKAAQKWARKCLFQYAPGESRKQNLYSQTFAPTENLEVARELFFKNAMEFWWSRLNSTRSDISTSKLPHRFEFSPAGSFYKMALGSNQRVGCGIATTCTEENDWASVMIVCNYEKRKGKSGDSLLYEVGKSCQSNWDCSSKKCSPKEGLCIVH